MDWSVVADGDPRNAKDTLQEITADNAKFRESNEIHEKYFDVELEEVPVEMRDDTKLVLVDIPGINEAGAGKKYKQYVACKWNTFDALVLVMDGKQGVNTEEQVSLLEFAKENLQKKKIPLIILCNKVDDPDDEEQALLVIEAQREVERVFNVSDRKASLDDLMNAAKNKARTSFHCVSPAFISTSAIHAFIYQTASLMSLDQFKHFDKDLIDKFGREEVGRWKWKKLSENEKYAVAHKVVSDPSQYNERLQATNFDKFLLTLVYAIGDSNNQLGLIKKQLAISLKTLEPARGLTSELKAIYEKSMFLKTPTEHLKAVFWTTYSKYEDKVFDQFEGPLDVDCLAVLMEELHDYYFLSCQLEWEDEKQSSLRRMKALIRRQFAELFNQERLNRKIKWTPNDAKEEGIVTWNSLSPEDWKNICRSILLLSFSEVFCCSFGREKVWIESLLEKIVKTAFCHWCERQMYPNPYSRNERWCTGCSPQLGFTLENGELDPMKSYKFSKMYQIKVPDSFSHPIHWGHIAWKYCQLLKSNSSS